MLKILSFVIFIVLLIVLYYGLQSTGKKSFDDVIDLFIGSTINNLNINEKKDGANMFETGYSHCFYLFIKEPQKTDERNIVLRGERGEVVDKFSITINEYNELKVKLGNVELLTYMVPLGKWIHVCVNVNPHAVELYIDGSLLKSRVNSKGSSTSDLYGENIILGHPATGTSYIEWMALYSYYDSALDSYTINKMYQDNVNKFNNTRDEYGLNIKVDKNDVELINYNIL